MYRMPSYSSDAVVPMQLHESNALANIRKPNRIIPSINIIKVFVWKDLKHKFNLNFL